MSSPTSYEPILRQNRPSTELCNEAQLAGTLERRRPRAATGPGRVELAVDRMERVPERARLTIRIGAECAFDVAGGARRR